MPRPEALEKNLVLIGDDAMGEKTLETHLKAKLGDKNVHNLAVNGFDTGDVRCGGDKVILTEEEEKTSIKYYPFDELGKIDHPTHVLISVGGNNIKKYLDALINRGPDDREGLLDALIYQIQEEYIKIIEEIKAHKAKPNPIIMLQYTPLITHDIHAIYYVMDLLQNRRIGGLLSRPGYLFYKTFGFLTESSQLGALKKLHDIMCQVYHPILNYAKAYKIPVIDLSSTFDYHEEGLYQSQIALSPQGSEVIATLVTHLLDTHDFKGPSKTYSRPGCDTGDILSLPTTETWQPHLAPKNQASAKALFLKAYQNAYARDGYRFFGLKARCQKTYIEEKKSLAELVKHAQGKSSDGSGTRSFQVMRELGWLNEDKSINEASGLTETLSLIS